jgi:phage gp36-like protein
MATKNPYCDFTQFVQRYDERTVREISGDDDDTTGKPENVEELLDDAAGELDSSLEGRWSIPFLPRQNAIQQLIVDATGGTYTLEYLGSLTAAIAFDALPAVIIAALEALPQIQIGDIDVQGGVGAGGGGTPYFIEFKERLGFESQPNLITDPALLTGGAGTAIVTTVVLGNTGPPKVLTRWVASRTAGTLFGRRADIPDNVRAEATWADRWIERLEDGKVSLPKVVRSNIAELDSSEAFDGTSIADCILGLDSGPTRTSTSKGKCRGRVL